MNIEQFNIELDSKAVSDKGAIEGYGSIYDMIDNGNDIVVSGAFDESLKSGKTVKMLWQHDRDKPIGVWHTVTSDAKGLRLEGQLNLDTQLGREAHSLLKTGAIDGLSIGYKVDDYSQENWEAPRHIKKATLWEVSIVTFPMNEAATVTDVKNHPTKRDCEKALRDAGFTRKQAAVILSKGYDATGLRDADREETTALKSRIDNLINIIKGY